MRNGYKRVRICKSYAFSASHFLPMVGKGHPCGRTHGHNYKVEIIIKGEVAPQIGWLIDFATIDGSMKPLLERLDHNHLNDIEGLDNPTAENIAWWIKDRYKPVLDMVVRVWETDKCYAETA